MAAGLIVLVITDLDVGGAEYALVSLAVHLNRNRWRPVVLCLGQPGQLVSFNSANVPVECLGVHRRSPVQAVTTAGGEASAARDPVSYRASCSMQTSRLALQLLGLVGRGWLAV